MNGFLIVGLLGAFALALFLWMRRRKRPGHTQVSVPAALPPRGDEPVVPTKPLYQVREGGDGGGGGGNS